MSQLPLEPQSDAVDSDPDKSSPNKELPSLEKGMGKLLEKTGGRQVVEMMMAQVGGNPLHNKITEEHISELIKSTDKHDSREFELLKKQQENAYNENFWRRIILSAVFITVIFLIVFVIWVFRNQPTVLSPILTGIGGIATGFLGGYGYAKKK